MIPLFSPAGRAALARLADARTILAFDFDGTLAPIVAARDAAGMPIALRQSLQALAARTPVAVISGRALADLTPRIPDGLLAIGNHGIEGSFAPPRAATTAREICRTWLHQLRGFAGPVEIDDKGCSLSLHGEPALLAAARSVVAALAPAPLLIAGKDVLNVIPPGMPDKGDALAALIAGTGATQALYVGDDDNDEPAFARGNDRVLTVRIRPSERSAAAFWLDDSHAMRQLIDELLALIPPFRTAGQGPLMPGTMT